VVKAIQAIRGHAPPLHRPNSPHQASRGPPRRSPLPPSVVPSIAGGPWGRLWQRGCWILVGGGIAGRSTNHHSASRTKAGQNHRDESCRQGARSKIEKERARSSEGADGRRPTEALIYGGCSGRRPLPPLKGRGAIARWPWLEPRPAEDPRGGRRGPSKPAACAAGLRRSRTRPGRAPCWTAGRGDGGLIRLWDPTNAGHLVAPWVWSQREAIKRWALPPLVARFSSQQVPGSGMLRRNK